MTHGALPEACVAFFARLAGAPARVLMTDYDGTLAPFRVERDRAAPYPGVREALQRLIAAGHTRVVVISGRVVDEVRRLLALEPAPEIWGSHGWERLTAGGYESWPLARQHARGLEEAQRWAAQAGLEGRSERKVASVALHWRGLDDEEIERLRRRACAQWAGFASACGLEIKEFDGGVELRAPGRDKGTAVRTILAESSAGVTVAYLGDDLTDEDAFAALDGKGLAVLVRPRPRSTKAHAWLCPPADLIAFLDGWCASVKDL